MHLRIFQYAKQHFLSALYILVSWILTKSDARKMVSLGPIARFRKSSQKFSRIIRQSIERAQVGQDLVLYVLVIWVFTNL